MKRSSRILRILPFVILGLSFLAALFQTLAYLLAYEAPKANYFSAGAPLPVIAAICAVLSCLAGVAVFPLIEKKALQVHELPMRRASLFGAIGFAAGAVILMLSVSGKLSTVTSILLLVSAAYSLCVAFLPAQKNAVTALLGFAAILGCILLDALYYFDTSLEMNAPVKVSVLIGVLCAMIYYTGELRILLGQAMPRLYLLLSSLAVGVGALSALPVPIAAITGIFNRSASPANAAFLAERLFHPEYLAGAVIVLGTAVCAWIRLWTLLRSPVSVSSDAEPAEPVATATNEEDSQ